jgi:hypothetical protein
MLPGVKCRDGLMSDNEVRSADNEMISDTTVLNSSSNSPTLIRAAISSAFFLSFLLFSFFSAF